MFVFVLTRDALQACPHVPRVDRLPEVRALARPIQALRPEPPFCFLVDVYFCFFYVCVFLIIPIIFRFWEAIIFKVYWSLLYFKKYCFFVCFALFVWRFKRKPVGVPAIPLPRPPVDPGGHNPLLLAIIFRFSEAAIFLDLRFWEALIFIFFLFLLFYVFLFFPLLLFLDFERLLFSYM